MKIDSTPDYQELKDRVECKEKRNERRKQFVKTDF